ncbi:hypothetical protein [Microvirga roseola]|uniref:hypothetical protein n=1 Tax=Microvirga roseola TaxID=2883126 RepID=UPI001E621E3B|nr:hypothetical protein [Microvirga roseola]
MGAAAAATVSNGKARKDGKKYRWGAERPGVLERRVQIRMKHLSKKLAEAEERAAKFRAAELAKVEAERLFLEEQKALLEQHREEVRRKRTFRPVHSFVVDDSFTEQEIEAIQAENPGIDAEEARVLLSLRARKSLSTGIVSGPSSAAALQGETLSEDQAIADVAAKPVPAPRASSPERAKPASVHIPAAVTISGGADGGHEWADFDPDAWEEGEEYPRNLYIDVLTRDGYRVLERRTDLEEPETKPLTPEIEAMRHSQQEYEARQAKIRTRHGINPMLWPPEVIDEDRRIDEELTALNIKLWDALDQL